MKDKFWYGVDGENYPFGPFGSREGAINAAVAYLEPNPGATIYVAEEVTIAAEVLPSEAVTHE